MIKTLQVLSINTGAYIFSLIGGKNQGENKDHHRQPATDTIKHPENEVRCLIWNFSPHFRPVFIIPKSGFRPSDFLHGTGSDKPGRWQKHMGKGSAFSGWHGCKTEDRCCWCEKKHFVLKKQFFKKESASMLTQNPAISKLSSVFCRYE